MTLEWRAYRFRPVLARPLPDETRIFSGRLRRALRAAHGLSIPIRMEWSSSATAAVTLSVPTPVGVRWMQFALAGAYELGQWQSVEAPETSSRALPRFVVSANGSVELPFPSTVDIAPWAESVLAELGGIGPGVVVEWDLVPDPTLPSPLGKPSSTGPRLAGEIRIRTSPERAVEDSTEARRTGLRWQLKGRILSDSTAENHEAASRLAHLIDTASHLDGAGGLRCRRASSPLARIVAGAILTEAELVGLFPPSASMAFLPRSEEASEGPKMWLGRDLRGTMAGLPLDPRQGRHLIVLGETGMGKSSLVVRLGWQALHWGSVLFFDPIGDTAREFLSGVPEARASQVSWVSPAVRGLTLSLLGEIETSSGRDPARRERMVGDVVAALRRVRAGRYVESTYWGPRIEEMLSQAIRAASLWPGASLALAERLLTPGAFPSRPIPPVARAAVADVRRRIDISPQDGDGARRLLSEITRSDVLRGILDAEAPTWAIGASVLPGRITVVSGDAPQVGESVARYLLAVVLALAWNAALAREQPTKTFLILDEAQWYAHDSVGEMLRLGRRFNLHVWAATQSLRSLPESIREAFTTNSADVVLFRGAPEEVRDFARWVPELGPERIMRMPRAEAAVLIGKGSRVHWIRLSPPKLGGSDPIHFAPRFPNAEAARDPERPIRSPAGECEPASARADPSTPPNEDPLARALRDLEAQAGSQAELTVRLSEIRSRWAGDPAIAESSVRTGGRTLASSGVLLRTGRDSSGSFWVLSRERLREMLGAQPIGTRSGTTADSNPLAPLAVPIPP